MILVIILISLTLSIVVIGGVNYIKELLNDNSKYNEIINKERE